MKHILLLLTAAFLFTGCTYNPIPEGYDGPTSTIVETYADNTGGHAHYFQLDRLNDKQLETSFSLTRSRYYGMGRYFEPIMKTHKVLPQEQTFSIHGYVFYPTDIQVLMEETFDVKGNFTFTPEAGKTYYVKGQIENNISSVWLEDASGSILSTKYTQTFQ